MKVFNSWLNAMRRGNGDVRILTDKLLPFGE